MRLPKPLSGLLAFAGLALLFAQPARPATVRHMNLAQMVDGADKIFRGTVLDVRASSVTVGGGELPTVVYRIRVDEPFKGSFEEVKGESITEVQMIGDLKPVVAGDMRRLSILPELPHLQIGHDYLILTTPPSPIGLSTTIGLGQGSFQITGKAGGETATNEVNNVGLFLGMNVSTPAGGALPYSALADQIRTLLGQ